MLESMGVDRVVLLDIHSVITQGFFTSSYTDIYGSEILSVDYFVDLGLENVVVVSPDAGAIKRTMKFLDLYNKRTGNDHEMVFVAKVRPEANVVGSTTVVGNVKDKNIIIVDVMIDTAGTIVKLADTLKQHGANDIYAFATHGLLSGPAAERILQSEFKQVAITDTIKQPKRILEHPKIKVIPIAQLLSNIVKETLI